MTGAQWSALALLGCSAVFAGCRERHEPPQPYDEVSPARRVWRTPPAEVHPVPPHAIHQTGVGPYVLGTPLKAVLDQIPHGPRVELAQIDGVMDYSLARTEGDALLIGVSQPTGTAFVTVLDPEIARTESGSGVGTSRKELLASMGPELGSATLVMDPRMVGFARLPNVRFVLDRSGSGKVIAVVVRSDLPKTPAGLPGSLDGGVPAPTCQVSRELSEHADEAVQAARLPPESAVKTVLFGCLSGVVPEALVVAGDRVALVGGEPGKLRRVATHAVPGLVYAALLEPEHGGHPDIAVVSEESDEHKRLWRLEILRAEPGRLVRVAMSNLYVVPSASVSWMGANLNEVELLIEMAAGPEILQVTGLYVHRGAGRPDTVAPLATVTVPIRRKRPGPAVDVAQPAAGADAGASRLHPE